MRRRLKLIAIAIGLIGAVAGLVDLLGCFRNAEREAIARLLVQTQDEIPRSTPGFELFLGAFPPPNGIEPTEVTAIADKILR